MRDFWGYRIKKFSSGILHEYNLGCREHLAYTRAMFTDNLFARYIADDLKVSKNYSTRDLISISFDTGSQSYEEAKKRIEKIIEYEEQKDKLENLYSILNNIEANKEKFTKMSKEEIRDEYYKNGLDITYTTYKKNGEIAKQQTIHYVKLYRSTGAAKNGDCIFISQRLYKKAHDFLYMGLKLPKHNAPIVELSAYASLIASSIVDTVHINPKRILVLNDFDSFFRTNVISIETDENRHCYVEHIDDYELKNTLYDGQALIDSSIFPSWGNGYILLRQHMTKCAAFKTNIQQFFMDYYGQDYPNAIIKDMWGNEHYAKDIQMITTDQAMKWLKFDVAYEYWCDKVNASNNEWGIVKTAHQSKLGDVQKMSYQMINCLDLDTMDNVTEVSEDYIYQLKTNDDVFLEYLRKNQNFANDFEVLLALVAHNPQFIKCEYFYQRRSQIIKAYIKKFKTGKVIQEGDNLVLVGNPYSMLMYAVGENPENEGIFKVEQDCVQCYTPRFKNGEYLAGFRSPHNGKNNIIALHNIYNPLFDRYFDLTKQCVAINCIHTPTQDRLNGCDFDSDSIYCTNQPTIVQHAKYCYVHYHTIVNNIPKEKNNYDNISEHYSLVDNNLAHYQLAIGESSNLAQLALTYTYNFDDERFEDYVCILSVLAQVAIDSAKRRFDIDINDEIKRLKKEMDIKTNGYPRFWLNIRKGFAKDKINYDLKCPMNHLANIRLKHKRYMYKSELLPIDYFFERYELKNTRRKSKRTESLIEDYALEVYKANAFNEEDMLVLREDFDELIETIRRTYISKEYAGLMSWLINRGFMISPSVRAQDSTIQRKTNANKQLLMKVLYEVSPKTFLMVFSKNMPK